MLFVEVPVVNFSPKYAGFCATKMESHTKFHLCAEDRACGVFLTSGAAILRNGIAFPPISVLVKLTNSMFSSGLPPKIGFTSGFEG